MVCSDCGTTPPHKIRTGQEASAGRTGAVSSMRLFLGQCQQSVPDIRAPATHRAVGHTKGDLRPPMSSRTTYEAGKGNHTNMKGGVRGSLGHNNPSNGSELSHAWATFLQAPCSPPNLFLDASYLGATQASLQWSRLF